MTLTAFFCKFLSSRNSGYYSVRVLKNFNAFRDVSRADSLQFEAEEPADPRKRVTPWGSVISS